MKRFAIFAAICFAIGCAGCSAIYQTIHIRYRLTIEVKVADQIKTGSGVIDIAYPIYPDVFVNLGGSTDYRPVIGYAVTVDLGEKGLLFLTFKSDESGREQTIRCLMSDIACLPFAAYGGNETVGGTYSREKAALRALQAQSGTREVSLSYLPTLIRFRDINDPISAEAISPTDLAAAYGPGAAIQRVVLELTNDPVTPMPSNWPLWLKNINRKIDGSRSCFLGQLCLDSTDFKGLHNG